MVQDSGFQQVFDPIKVKFKPTAKDMQVAEESGTDLAQAIQKKQKAAQKQTSKQASTGAAFKIFLYPACLPAAPNHDIVGVIMTCDSWLSCSQCALRLVT